MDPTFPYAGKVRVPPKEFLLRSRIETNTKDWVNKKQFEHWQTDVPDFTYNYPKIVYAKGRMYENINDRPIGYSRMSDEEDRKMSQEVYGNSNISYRDASSDRTPSYAREKIPQSLDTIAGYKQPNYKISNIPYDDMNPINTRTDSRDYKQAQPYVAGGPDLEYNPYFDRYDPISDSRNAVRELRSAVYEDKGTSRGLFESQGILRRQFENRWMNEEIIDEDLMDTYLRYEIAIAGKEKDNK